MSHAGGAPITEPVVQVWPLADIPFPVVALGGARNPLPAIVDAPKFQETVRFFSTSPSSSRSLLTGTAQAMLYSVLRNSDAENVVEIGTYKAGTTEALARAVVANGKGTVHTVSPFDAERFAAISQRWPDELRKAVRYHKSDSMQFFIEADHSAMQLDCVLIDGNHDYEFAAFDIQASARRLKPGGFLFIDNVSQAGPYFATKEFLHHNSNWTDCGTRKRPPSETLAFDPSRSNFSQTDFFILRSPDFYCVGARPITFGESGYGAEALAGLKLSLAAPVPEAGTLSVQCILRAFSEQRLAELVGVGIGRLTPGETRADVLLDAPLRTDGRFDRFVVEPWLAWSGATPLQLRSRPTAY